jgi:uncharacterized membrane protein
MIGTRTHLTTVREGIAVERTDAGIDARVDAPAAVALLVCGWGAALLAAVLAAATALPAVVTTPPIVIALSFVPGGLALIAALGDIDLDARTVAYAFGLSLLATMATGFVANLVLPVAGITRPLATVPGAASVTVLVLGLAAAALDRHSDATVRASIPSFVAPTPLLLLSLPFAAVVGKYALVELGGSVEGVGIAGVRIALDANEPLIVVLTVVAVVPLALVAGRRHEWYALGIWTAALAVLYHASIGARFNGSPGVVRAFEAARWTPGVSEVGATATELLPNGVLFPLVAHLTGLDIMSELELVNPFLVAFLPLAIFATVRRYLGPRRAVLAATLVVFAHPFSIQYPTAGRVATPVLFLALFGLAVSDPDLGDATAPAFALVFASGVVVSHYGTAYFVLFALLGVVGLLVGLEVADEFRHRLSARARADGGTTGHPDSRGVDRDRDRDRDWGRGRGLLARVLDRLDGRTPDGRRTLVSWRFVLYYTVAATGWYLFATGGTKFRILPNQIASTLAALFGEEASTGRTTARLQRDYGAPSIAYAKALYGVIGVAMVVGLLVAYYRRFHPDREAPVDDRYLGLGTVMLGVFGLTFLVRNWGGGRPMMITFVFTGAFAALGATWVAARAGRALREAAARVAPRLAEVGVRPESALAVVLAVLFVLNAGVAAQTVLPPGSPTDGLEPGSGVDTGTTDIAAHVWVIEHHDPDGPNRVYGDRIAFGQSDWYRPSIEYGTDGHGAYRRSGLLKPEGFLHEHDDPNVEPGYVLLLGHNLESGTVQARVSREEYPIERVEPDLSQRHRVYTTGRSVVLYANQTVVDGTGTGTDTGTGAGTDATE